jgi:4,5-DOPA dioxygenase extradiol
LSVHLDKYTMSRFPVLFVSHGAPTLPLETSAANAFLSGLGRKLGRPSAILAVSAHWETEQPAVSAAAAPETIYDFYGFPQELYRLRYPAPGAPQLAERVAELLQAGGLPVAIDRDRGLDHGAWTPLILMYPEADIPVTQLSVQPGAGAAHHFRLGEALRPLRDEGVLILASGGITHNLHEFRGRGRDDTPPQWVSEFNEWMAGALQAGRRQDLIDYRARAPHAARNHPSEEHLLPLLVAAGAGSGQGGATRLHASYAYGVIGMDAYRFD